MSSAKPGISASRALQDILGRVSPLGTVTLSLRRAADRALAGKITAGADVPPFDNSAMDGYALRYADIGHLPAVLKITGETAAGALTAHHLSSGEAWAVMTGAPIPAGADTVVPVELTDDSDPGNVRILKPVTPGANIRRAGSDIPKGSDALDRGQTIRPFEQGVLASMGIEFVNVYRKPSVCLLSTGDELTGPGRPLGPGKIRESNSHAIGAMLTREGCEVVNPGITPDDPAGLGLRIAAGLRSDMLITMGGVSAGKYDVVPRLLAEAGVDIVFHRVQIKPGMPLLFGMKGAIPVFGLPGNPVSSIVTFSQFVRPAIRALSGCRDPADRLIVRARLEVELKKKDGKRHYVRGILNYSGNELTVKPAGTQDSHSTSVLSRANCLILLPEEKNIFSPSELVETEVL